MVARLQSVLADGEDNLLHGLGVLVVVGHEELLVTGVTVLLGPTEVVGVRIQNAVAVVLGLLVIVDLAVGVDHGVERQASVEGKGRTAVGASEVLGVAVGTHILHQRLDGRELLIDPLVEVDAALLGRQVAVKLHLERSLVEEVEEW